MAALVDVVLCDRQIGRQCGRPTGAGGRTSTGFQIIQRTGKTQLRIIHNQTGQGHIPRIRHVECKGLGFANDSVNTISGRFDQCHAGHCCGAIDQFGCCGRCWGSNPSRCIRRNRSGIGNTACIHIRLLDGIGTGTSIVGCIGQQRCNGTGQRGAKEAVRDLHIAQRGVARISHGQGKVHHITRHRIGAISGFGEYIIRRPGRARYGFAVILCGDFGTGYAGCVIHLPRINICLCNSMGKLTDRAGRPGRKRCDGTVETSIQNIGNRQVA